MDTGSRELVFPESKQRCTFSDNRPQGTITCKRLSTMVFSCTDEGGRVYKEVPLVDEANWDTGLVYITCPVLRSSDYLMVGWKRCTFVMLSSTATGQQVLNFIMVAIYIAFYTSGGVSIALIGFLCVHMATKLGFNGIHQWINQFYEDDSVEQETLATASDEEINS